MKKDSGLVGGLGSICDPGGGYLRGATTDAQRIGFLEQRMSVAENAIRALTPPPPTCGEAIRAEARAKARDIVHAGIARQDWASERFETSIEVALIAFAAKHRTPTRVVLPKRQEQPQNMTESACEFSWRDGFNTCRKRIEQNKPVGVEFTQEGK